MPILPQQPEESFSELLKKYILKQRSIDDLQRHKTFCRFLRDDCYRFDLTNFGGVYSSEDLYQDSFMKTRKSAPRLQIVGDILSEEEFASWLFVVVRSVVRSKDRQLNKQRRKGFVSVDKSSAELVLPAPDVNNDGKYYFGLLLDFLKDYPEEHRRAVLLWLNGFSLRKIKEILIKEYGEDACVSYGTIRNRVLAILKAFKKRLGLQTPKKKQA